MPDDSHLSIVAVSRNDDHGGDMLGRMQHFVDGLIAQCRNHDLEAELILVEWNPPPQRPLLEEVLQWPADFGPVKVRIITVPPWVHARFPHADALPLFQMIGKNVGIRRARGRYVLATNVDILFDDATVRYLRDRLRAGIMLRADRYDVPGDLGKDNAFDQILAGCRDRFFQINTRFGTFDLKRLRFVSMGDSFEARLLAFCTEIHVFGPVKPLRRQWRRALSAMGDSVKVLCRALARLQHLQIRASAAARRPRAFLRRFFRAVAESLARCRDAFVSLPRAFGGAIHVCLWVAVNAPAFLRREVPKIVPLRTMPSRGYWYVRRVLRRMHRHLAPRMPKPLRLAHDASPRLLRKGVNSWLAAKSALGSVLTFVTQVWSAMRRAGSKGWRVVRPIRLMRPLSTAERLFALSQRLHTNACGDFTLLARDDWFRLRGYPEWPIFSWHIDSVFMFAANAQGLREVALGPKCRIYHIDHSKGSGWSLDGAAQLFDRLDGKGIPYLTNKDVAQLQTRFALDPSSAIVNEAAWGLAAVDLSEREVRPANTRSANADRRVTGSQDARGRQIDTASAS